MIAVGLFGELERATPAEKKETERAERKRKAKLAYDYTADAWKKATYKLAVEEFLPRHADFTFEEFSEFYNAEATRRGMPLTVNGKAFAGLRLRLVREGLIETIHGTTRVRSNGQLGIVYRSTIYAN